jgi:DMSO/TMAO reductase YedYZ molybdopterin-dependent catalytic subunit
VILAEQMNGKPLGPDHFRLVVPGDQRGGRSVRDVVSITIETLSSKP